MAVSFRILLHEPGAHSSALLLITFKVKGRYELSLVIVNEVTLTPGQSSYDIIIDPSSHLHKTFFTSLAGMDTLIVTSHSQDIFTFHGYSICVK